MLGAIIGDVVGSVYEHHRIKTTDFPLFQYRSRFTDDTVLTIAVAEAILNQTEYGEAIKAYGQRYPDAGYGGSFTKWILAAESKPYHSWGNGSAMRVSPVGLAFSAIDEVLQEAKRSAMVTHDHPEGIKGAQATALAMFLARTGVEKEEIRAEISQRFDYDLDRTVEDIRPGYKFEVSCQKSVPESIIAFLDSTSYEDTIRKAVSLGGDSDTLACIAGCIAEAYYKEIPVEMVQEVRSRLPEDFLQVIDEFYACHPLH
jgi:ADP-ribosylglycohydrolase